MSGNIAKTSHVTPSDHFKYTSVYKWGRASSAGGVFPHDHKVGSSNPPNSYPEVSLRKVPPLHTAPGLISYGINKVCIFTQVVEPSYINTLPLLRKSIRRKQFSF